MIGLVAVPFARILAPLRIFRESLPDSPLRVVQASIVRVGDVVSSPIFTGPLKIWVADAFI